MIIVYTVKLLWATCTISKSRVLTCGHCKVRVAHTIRIWVLSQIHVANELSSGLVVVLWTYRCGYEATLSCDYRKKVPSILP
jgi:hypothetical protein